MKQKQLLYLIAAAALSRATMQGAELQQLTTSAASSSSCPSPFCDYDSMSYDQLDQRKKELAGIMESRYANWHKATPCPYSRTSRVKTLSAWAGYYGCFVSMCAISECVRGPVGSSAAIPMRAVATCCCSFYWGSTCCGRYSDGHLEELSPTEYKEYKHIDNLFWERKISRWCMPENAETDAADKEE